MKLHLGCGKRKLPGWINIDSRADADADVVCDVSDLSQYMDGCADVVYACHVLEHIPRTKTLDVLRAWRRVLKPGGLLRLSVPDFRTLCRLYRDDKVPMWRIVGALVGRQDYPENTHFNVFDYDYLAWHLEQAGFYGVRVWWPEPWSGADTDDLAIFNLDDYSRAAIDGKPISLNVEALRGG